jgi:hypothetical protein
MPGSNQSEYPYLYTGAFCVYYGRDEGRPVVMVIERGKHFKGTKSEGYGTAGGYVDVADGKEQPADGAARELREEILKPDSTPVLDTVTPDRLQLIGTAIDYAVRKPEIGYAGNVWHGHKCELTADEMAKLKTHIKNMASDPAYAEAVREASHQEVENVLLLSPEDLSARIASGQMKFAYDHEKQMVLKVARELMPVPAPKISIRP